MIGSVLEPVDIALWSLVIVVFFVVIIFFVNKHRKMEEGSGAFILGIVFFATFFTLARVIETIRRALFRTSYIEIFETNFQLEGLDLIMRLSYYVFIWTGIAIFYFVFEKYVMNQRTKYILMVTSLFTTFLSFVMYFIGWQYWVFMVYAVCFFVVGLFPVILFLYLSKSSINRAQRIAWLIMIGGFLLLLIGVLGDMPEAYIVTQSLDPEFIRFFSPLGQAMGAVLMAYSLSIIYKYV